MSPYGFSVWGAGSPSKAQAAGIQWLRVQLDWSSIESSPGSYDFTGLDRTVAWANAVGIHLTFPLQDAPNFRKTQTYNGVALFPGPAEMTAFATVVARRYNGKNGHGFIDSFEIGNEEYDAYWGGSWEATRPCRTANWYGPVLKAGYQAIKKESPTALVGMFGLWWLSTSHFREYLTWLYQNGYGAFMDFANFHYYSGTDPALTNGDVPSYDLAWQTIQGVMASFAEGSKPIWCTEVNWTVSGVNQSGPRVTPADQAAFLRRMLDSSRTSKAVQRVFLYTIGDNDDGMNLWPTTGPLPSFAMLGDYMAQYPSWTVA